MNREKRMASFFPHIHPHTVLRNRLSKLRAPCELCERRFYSINHKIDQFINKNTTLLSMKISKKCISLKKSSEFVTASVKTIVYDVGISQRTLSREAHIPMK
jgi:hypothetical protein